MDAEVIDEIEVLEDETDVVFAYVHQLVLGTATHFFPIKPIFATAWGVDHAYYIEQRRLSTTRGPHHSNEFALADMDVYLIQRRRFHVGGAVNFA